jgi:hypothetical protein
LNLKFIKMDFYNIDKEVIKDAINEMVESNPQIFKEAIDKVLDKKATPSIRPEDDLEFIDAIIFEHFKEYEDVFRALA